MTDRDSDRPDSEDTDAQETIKAREEAPQTHERSAAGDEGGSEAGTRSDTYSGGGFSSLTRDRGDLWRRALFMLLFALLYSVAKFVLGVVVVVQFLVVLFTSSANEQLLRLGSSLSIYSYQVFRFLTFTGDEQPFPMSAWPEDEAEGSPWFERES